MHETNMNQYTIAFDDPSCSTWTVFHLEKPVVMPASFGNVVDHFFTGDVFTFDETSGQVTLLSSPVRERPCLVGVVILEGRRTYGQMGKKQLWKCMPLLQDIPPFLLAYDPGPIGFSKVAINRYVSFRFHSWNKEQKHPIASCLSTFGEVIRLDAYTDYYLTHHGLFPRPKLSMVPSSLSSFVDNTPVVTNTIFSLDPHGATLFDDALSYNLLPCGSHQIDIFIANVVDALGKFSIKFYTFFHVSFFVFQSTVPHLWTHSFHHSTPSPLHTLWRTCHFGFFRRFCIRFT